MAKTTTPTKKPKKETTHKLPLLKSETIVITIPWKILKNPLAKRVATASAKLKLDGFRKGKVPQHIAKKYLNLEDIKHHTIEEVMVPLFIEATKEKQHVPIGYPELKTAETPEESDWNVVIDYALKPEIKLGNYTKLISDARKTAQKTVEKETDEKTAEESIIRQIYTSLLEKVNPEVPELLVKQENNSRLQELMRSLDRIKATFEDYLAKTGQTADQVFAEKQAESLASLQIEFLIQSLLEAEKITASPEEIEKKITEFKDEKLQKFAREDERYQERLAESIKREKLTQFLLGKNGKKTDKKA